MLVQRHEAADDEEDPTNLLRQSNPLLAADDEELFSVEEPLPPPPARRGGTGRPIANAATGQKKVETWNDDGSYGVRILQREVSVVGGSRVVTKIEVMERADEGDETVVFSVRHTHAAVWRRQLQVHKNLLLACVLAGVACPVEIPPDSTRVFKSVDNLQHVHIYLERVIPHFRFRNLPPEVSVFWWRAVGSGSLVFQNWLTGRLIILPCKTRGMLAAAETLRRALQVVRNMSPQFWEPDPEYEGINVAADEEAASHANDEGFPSMKGVADTVQSWALEDGVSPWMTKLIVKCRGPRRGQILQYRYSIGVDVAEEGTRCEEAGSEESVEEIVSAQIFFAIQVHCNEPLSRELKAYPVCMVPVAVEELDYRNLTALYLRSLWFLRKLFEYHVSMEQMEQAKRPPAQRSRAKGFQLREAEDSRDLTAKNRLVGGARLAQPPRFQSVPSTRTRIATVSPRAD